MMRDIETSDLYRGMNLQEIAADMTLTELKYNTGYVSRSDLCETTEMKRNTFRKGIKKLMNRDIVGESPNPTNPREKALYLVESNE